MQVAPAFVARGFLRERETFVNLARTLPRRGTVAAMKTTPRTRHVAAALVLAPVCLWAMAGCSDSTTPTTPATPVSGAAAMPSAVEVAALPLTSWAGRQSIVLDGDVGEWPADIAAVADEHWLYLRFTIDGPPRTLQGMDTPMSIFLDADGDPATGRPIAEPAVEGGLGADIEVVFSPRESDAPRVGQGVMFRVHMPDGTARVVPHDRLGFSFTPTHAAEWYEARLSRHAFEDLGLNVSSRIAGVVVLHDGRGAVSAWADPFEVEAPPVRPWSPADARVPAKPEGAARVLSWNVEHTSPAKNPEPFARVIRVLDPDVMLFQEWVEGDADSVRAWLVAHVDDATQWHVLKGRAWGVVVASKHPLRALTPQDPPSPEGGDNPMRFLGALAQTPGGPLAVGSAHLKCCGTSDSREDRTRLAEARSIADLLAAALGQSPGIGAWGVVVGGDLNLVGSRAPLEALGRGGDLDASDLAVAGPMIVGDAAMHTWADAGNAFTPGRLDYLLYSDAVADAVNAFVLDTGVLNEAALARLGLDAGDTSASDHRPVVVDLRPKR